MKTYYTEHAMGQTMYLPSSILSQVIIAPEGCSRTVYPTFQGAKRALIYQLHERVRKSQAELEQLLEALEAAESQVEASE